MSQALKSLKARSLIERTAAHSCLQHFDGAQCTALLRDYGKERFVL
ncbi:MAG: hypothetical protein WCD53_27370 [Microcoleus sp.]